MMGKSKNNTTLLSALTNAFSGIVTSFANERNMKIHTVAAVGAVLLALYFQLTLVEWVLLLLTIALVIITELLNTAIETVVDMVSPEYHPLAKIAKDAAAGAVLISALTSLVVAYLLFGKRLL